MRPPRYDIAAPPFDPRTRWLGARREPSMDRLAAGGPVLVHFFDFAELNSVRTLPYVRAWHERYEAHGLTALGVHTPRFPFTTPEEEVSAAIDRLAIPYPVAVDGDRSIWRDYGCRGWPSLFLWGKGGALRWYHFGQGEYRATEEAIQAEIEAGGVAAMPEPLVPLRPEDEPGATVIAQTAEMLPGGSEEVPWSSADGPSELTVEYGAAGAFASVDGCGGLEIELDGERRSIRIEHPGLVEIADHGRHGEHRLELRTDGPRVWAISFAAGPQPAS